MREPGKLTDEMVRAAVAGAGPERARVLKAIEPCVEMMIVDRLRPTPGQSDAVQDIKQDALLALTAGLSRLRTRTVAGLKQFARRIVRTIVSDWLNTRPGLKSLDSTVSRPSGTRRLVEIIAGSGTSPSSAARRAELVQGFWDAVEELKPEYREILKLAFREHLDKTRDIGERLGISREAASMRLKRALEAVQQILNSRS